MKRNPSFAVVKNNGIVTVNGREIRKNKQGLRCLTDVYDAVKGNDAQRPGDWLALPSTIGFLAATCRFLNAEKSGIIKTRRGRYGGTYGHLQVLLEYAQYLSPNLAVAVNQVFLERVEEEKNPDLILDRAEATYRRRGFTDGQIRARFLGKATRKDFVSVLARHGVQRPEGFRLCTNATYKPLWGGTAAAIRERKNLPQKANPREHMSEKELVSLHLAELLATESIEQKDVRGNQACAQECQRAAQTVSRMLVQHRQGNRAA